ncbi:unnamed protein product [Parascedosporium putredinis]|uniref:Uncharacterized protein n=1 Tax=Parascedosporium putredinis TaxID=1442378 RepID=A0A9P1GXH6_9PEZI|nr:unnamed protein product [Parascedosporium putredinis]CAI7990606.1 unnamed protein product [Parascedosporium putredinis]
MQRFLTRAGKARGSRYNQLAGGAGVPRAPNSWPVNARNAFTTLYTSVLATAAVVDAKRKDDRAKLLDSEIDQAKEAVARLRLENAEAEARLFPEIFGATIQADGGSRSLGRHKPRPTRTTPRLSADPTSTKMGVYEAQIWEWMGGQCWDVFHPQNYKRTLVKLNTTDHQSIQDWLDATASSDREDKLMTVARPEEYESSVMGLVNTLLIEHDRMRWKKAKESEPKSPLRIAIDRLLVRGLPNIWWDNRDLNALRWGRTELSARFRRDVVGHDRLGTIERICYSLLTSLYPVTMHSYNTLIVQLTKAGHGRLAGCVTRAHFAHFRYHHPQSAAAVLYHDKEVFNHAGVSRKVNVIFRRLDSYLARGGCRLLEAMVGAYAGIGNLTDAVVVLCHGITLGLCVRSKELIKLIGQCIWNLDRSLAAMLIRSFTDNQEILKAVLESDPALKPVLLHQINYLLDVSNLWQQPASLAKRLREYNINPERFGRLRKALAILGVERELQQASQKLRQIEKSLGMQSQSPLAIPQDATLARRIDEALKIANKPSAHLRAAMPAAWAPRISPKDEEADRSFEAGYDPTHEIIHGHRRVSRKETPRVWDAEDYRAARMDLRIVALAKQVKVTLDKQRAFSSLVHREVKNYKELEWQYARKRMLRRRRRALNRIQERVETLHTTSAGESNSIEAAMWEMEGEERQRRQVERERFLVEEEKWRPAAAAARRRRAAAAEEPRAEEALLAATTLQSGGLALPPRRDAALSIPQLSPRPLPERLEASASFHATYAVERGWRPLGGRARWGGGASRAIH